ncbi:MAG: efflux RND transporter periplasmic adaptor subunit [Guyparkeria sp.]|uniref:efflux RND transporter periplasmic adaptor subunit n=1 Tax=Guyparkeria sp. TaxID=2035736 RepID=UPI00397CC05A
MTPDYRHRTPSRFSRAARPLLAGSLALGAALLAGGCDDSPDQRQASINQDVEIQGEWLTIETSPTKVASWFPGTITASRQAPVASRVSGFVRELNVDEGDSVKKGDTLLVIDQSSLDGQIRQAEANLAKARAGLESARREYERFKRLYEQEAVPEQRFDQMRTAYESAKGDHAAAEAAVDQARSETNYTRIRAPFDGLVVERMAEAGQLANPGQPLLMLHGKGSREVRLQVDDQAYARLPVDSETRVTYRDREGAERHFDADVLTAVGAADPITRTHTVKLSVPDDIDLDPGQFVLVRVELERRDSVVVPERALHQRAGIDGVFVLDEDDRARFRVVRLGQRTDGDVTVLSGLEAGDRVVTRAEGRLGNGVTIRGEQPS